MLHVVWRDGPATTFCAAKGNDGLAVVGGLDRWEGRLAALERRLEADLAALELVGDPAVERVRRSLGDLGGLRRFALPLLGALAALPREAMSN